jgi:hypothetical protein
MGERYGGGPRRTRASGDKLRRYGRTCWRRRAGGIPFDWGSSFVTRSRFSIRLVATGAVASTALLGTTGIASAAPRATTDTITLRIAGTSPHVFHPDAVSGTVPSWTKSVIIQRKIHGTTKWSTYDTVTATKGKYKDTDTVEFGLNVYDLRAVAGAVGKHKSIATKAVKITPKFFAYDSGTLTGLVATTPPLQVGDAVALSYSFTCPTGTAAHAFGLVDLIGGEADSVIDDDASGTGGSDALFLDTDPSQLFGVEALGATTCTWSVQVAY